MATTLLDAVNRVLIRVGEISQVSPLLTSLTDSPRQVPIDLSIQLWNDAIQYVQGWDDLPEDIATGTFTLISGEGLPDPLDARSYDTASNFQGFVGDAFGNVYFVSADPQYKITEYPGGWRQMFVEQPDPTQFKGQPSYFVYNPETLKIVLNTIPQDDEAGTIFSYLYNKTITLQTETDVIPLPDAAVNILVQSVAEAYKLTEANNFTADVWKIGVSESLRLTNKKATRRKYG